MSKENPLIVFGAYVYSLSPIRKLKDIDKLPETYFVHDKIVYAVKPSITTEELNTSMERELEKKIFFTKKELEKKLEYYKSIAKLLGKPSEQKLSKNKIILEEQDEIFYACTDMREFVLKSPETGKLFKFPSTRIGVKLKIDEKSKELMCEASYVMDNKYRHPFIGDRNICMGTFEEQRDLPIEEQIIRSLYATKQILESGYHSSYNDGDRGPYRKLTSDRFSNFIISEKEVKAKKIPITNIHVARGRKYG